jgi:eukaryotic-like serine/threonine-protein kinase
MDPAQPGDLIDGRYRLQAVIGRGGMGVVWLGTDEFLHRDVAIKETVRPHDFDDAEWDALRERSLSEARLAARLSHPSIVAVFDILEQDGRPWLVMQLVPFPSLRDVIGRSGPLSPAHAAQVGLTVLGAIEAAHSAGVLHRDVKPGNVLLGPDNQVYLADFGLAVTDGSPHATRSGLIMGSPAYMSPERARGDPPGPAADLWSLGATLYAAVEGRDPFARNGSAAVLAAVVTEDPDAPFRAGSLWPVISGLLNKDPAQRLTADQARLMLEPVAETDNAAYLFDDAAQLAAPDQTAVLPALSYQERGPGRGSVRRRGRHPVAIFLASVIAMAAVGLGAFVAVGKLAGDHSAAPSVTHSPSVTRSADPDPTPSNAGYSYPPWAHHHGWNNGDGNGNQGQYGNGNGNGYGHGNGNGD